MALVSPFAGNSLLAQDGAFEPQRKSNFALIIPDIGGDLLVLSVKNVKPPGIGVSNPALKHFNTPVKYAGAMESTENMPISYYDYLDTDVLDRLSAWFKQVYNPVTGAIGRARDYKRRGSLLLLPPGMEPSAAPGIVDSRAYRNRVWVCRGLFPKKLAPDDFDHESDAPAMINLELSCDMCYPRALDE